MRTRCVLLAALAPLALASVTPAQTYRSASGSPRAMIGFGSSIAIVGQEIFVGRPGLVAGFPMPPSEIGAIHIFVKRGQAWTETGSVHGHDVKIGDGFGVAMSAEGSLLAIGSPNANEKRGAVYIFERGNSGAWTEMAKFSATDAAAGDEFGAALQFSSGALFVGAPGKNDAHGAVLVFKRGDAGSSWSEAGRITGSGITGKNAFGASLAVSGDLAVVGAPGLAPEEFATERRAPGVAFVFRSTGGKWTEAARLAPPSDTAAMTFGTAVLTDGTNVLVSSPLGNRAAGVVFRYGNSGGNWTVAQRITAAAVERPEMFGASMAWDAGTLIVGAPYSGQGGGAVHILTKNASGSWAESQKFTIPNVGLGTQLGAHVAIGGGLAAAGAPGADFFEGKTLLYSRDGGGKWAEAGAVFDTTAMALASATGEEIKCTNGKAMKFDCHDVDLVAFMPNSALGAARGIVLNDMWGWTDEESGREFALVGRIDGTAFVEVTDPSNPVYLGWLPLHEGAHINVWRDIKTYKDHAYIVSDGAGPHGMQIFDLRQLLDVKGPPQKFAETAHYDKIASAHNIAIDTESGYAYTIGNSMGGTTCGGGPHMIDIREPENPKFAGCWADTTTGNARTGYTHDAQCTVYRGPDETYAGHQICFDASETALGIADVTDHAHPKKISSASYPNVAYAHQGWLSDDHKYFFLDDEGDELAGSAPHTRTIVFDVTDLDDPVVAQQFFGTTSATDHNLYVKGRYMYQSNYVAGLRVIDVKDPTNPVEVGYFDTEPFGANAPGFAGTWSNYPFFKSGVVAVTSMREGWFLVRYRPSTVVP
jgi:choice-of-anchor B domain-containing protein